MKLFESTFEDNLKGLNELDLHKYNDVSNIDKLNNIILYGAKGIGKYTQALKIIKKFSKSNLKYERKLSFVHNKEEYTFPLSDVHVEVDISMLGCISKQLWHEIYKNYFDVILSSKNKCGIILCKNFDDIHIELYDVFDSYMTNLNEHINIKFILLTENLSFINNEILNRCNLINLSKISKTDLQKINKLSTNKLLSMHCYDEDFHNKICDKIINYILNNKNININEFREMLYELLIYNLKISNCIWYIIKSIFSNEKYEEHITNVLIKSTTFFHYYNNNYRPIYHLENFFIYLINTINGIN